MLRVRAMVEGCENRSMVNSPFSLAAFLLGDSTLDPMSKVLSTSPDWMLGASAWAYHPGVASPPQTDPNHASDGAFYADAGPAHASAGSIGAGIGGSSAWGYYSDDNFSAGVEASGSAGDFSGSTPTGGGAYNADATSPQHSELGDGTAAASAENSASSYASSSVSANSGGGSANASAGTFTTDGMANGSSLFTRETGEVDATSAGTASAGYSSTDSQAGIAFGSTALNASSATSITGGTANVSVSSLDNDTGIHGFGTLSPMLSSLAQDVDPRFTISGDAGSNGYHSSLFSDLLLEHGHNNGQVTANYDAIASEGQLSTAIDVSGYGIHLWDPGTQLTASDPAGDYVTSSTGFSDYGTGTSTGNSTSVASAMYSGPAQFAINSSGSTTGGGGVSNYNYVGDNNASSISTDGDVGSSTEAGSSADHSAIVNRNGAAASASTAVNAATGSAAGHNASANEYGRGFIYGPSGVHSTYFETSSHLNLGVSGGAVRPSATSGSAYGDVSTAGINGADTLDGEVDVAGGGTGTSVAYVYTSGNALGLADEMLASTTDLYSASGSHAHVLYNSVAANSPASPVSLWGKANVDAAGTAEQTRAYYNTSPYKSTTFIAATGHRSATLSFTNLSVQAHGGGGTNAFANITFWVDTNGDNSGDQVVGSFDANVQSIEDGATRTNVKYAAVNGAHTTFTGNSGGTFNAATGLLTFPSFSITNSDLVSGGFGLNAKLIITMSGSGTAQVSSDPNHGADGGLSEVKMTYSVSTNRFAQPIGPIDRDPIDRIPADDGGRVLAVTRA